MSPTSAARRRHAPVFVVGTDLSAASHAAVTRAATIARRERAKLLVLHASPRIPAALARSLGIQHPQEVPRALGELEAELREDGTDVEVRQVTGSPSVALQDACETKRAALLVVGSRGRTVPDDAIGSTAERLSDASGRPVLLVRRPASAPYGQVVVAVSPEVDLPRMLEKAELVAPDAEVTILHAYAGPYETALQLHDELGHLQAYRRHARREAEESMLEVFERAGVDPSRLVLKHGDPRRVLTSVGRSRLLVVQRGRSRVKRFFLGSTSRWVVAYGNSDVLLV